MSAERRDREDGSGQDEERSDSGMTAAEMLVGLARLDAEAAQAYLAAADAIEDAPIRTKLREFARDHERHVTDLKARLAAMQETELVRALDGGMTLLSVLVEMAAPLGTEAVLATLLNNEQLTNLTYEDALAYDWEEDVERMLERNRADEERHFAWLAEQHTGKEEDAQPGAPPA